MKYLSHIIVAVLILMVSFISVDISVSAIQQVTPLPSITSLLEPTEPYQTGERSVLSVRSDTTTPSPLPTPVPVVSATPLATATPKPVITSVPAPSMIWPAYGTISQYFSVAHPAIDIASACQSKIAASASGTVTYAGWRNNGGGNVISITTALGVMEYNHLASMTVVSGQWVAQGQLIGYMGATGVATGCHLHFSLIIDSIPTDSVRFLP